MKERQILAYGIIQDNDNLLLSSIRHEKAHTIAFAISYYGQDWDKLEAKGFICVPVDVTYTHPDFSTP